MRNPSVPNWKPRITLVKDDQELRVAIHTTSKAVYNIQQYPAYTTLTHYHLNPEIETSTRCREARPVQARISSSRPFLHVHLQPEPIDARDRCPHNLAFCPHCQPSVIIGNPNKLCASAQLVLAANRPRSTTVPRNWAQAVILSSLPFLRAHLSIHIVVTQYKCHA